jgi:hypothetical protein
MSSTINASTASGGGVITTADASGILQLQTAGVTGLTIDASQNVTLNNVIPSGSTAPTNGMFLPAASAIGFSTSSSERMRIDSSGNLLVGTTSVLAANTMSVVSSGSSQMTLRNSSATGGLFWQVGADSSSTFKVYNASNAGVFMSNGATSWSSSSDERLKTDLKPIKDAVNKINQLRSVTGRFKTDEEGVSRSFLIAQDVQKVLPEAVSVQDDELGTLGVAYTEVIPLLVASIKELKAIIDTQNARIEALEAK